MQQLHYGLLIAVLRILLCLVSGGGKYKKATNRTALIVGLNVLFAGFQEKISWSIPFPMNYWPNYPVFH